MNPLRPIGLLILLALGCVVPAAHSGVHAQTGYRIINDDRVRARGIAGLARALKALGEVTIVVPADNPRS